MYSPRTCLLTSAGAGVSVKCKCQRINSNSMHTYIHTYIHTHTHTYIPVSVPIYLPVILTTHQSHLHPSPSENRLAMLNMHVKSYLSFSPSPSVYFFHIRRIKCGRGLELVLFLGLSRASPRVGGVVLCLDGFIISVGMCVGV